jgi:alkanesulfonate monooxygenase SsuD/methylene tetrahydromethanopterin reductase-like flavin-dependent oxidoreductase (luciferase family)
MKSGYLMLFQNAHEGLSDADMVKKEMELAVLTEECGFDTVWSAEHHFDWYSMIPDNLQALTYVAAKTSRIQLGTGAVILPWNEPIRVAEKLSMLDALCDGRLVYGIGRGLARKEYESFGIDMEEARGRFEEAAPMIVEALETGFIEGDGPFYPQKRTEIRPRPSRSFKGRLYGVAMSPDSAPTVGRLGCTMMFFPQFEIEKHIPGVDLWRDAFTKHHGGIAPPPVAIDTTYCHKDAGKAEEMSRKYIAGYYLSVLEHYEFLEDYHRTTKGYETYAAAADILKAAGKEQSLEDYVSNQATGTPQQILDKLEARRNVLGDFEWNMMLSYSGMPFEEAEKSMRLIGKEVLPEVQSWGMEPVKKQVA